MRTAVAETSIDTYRALRRDGSLTRQQRLLMAVIRPYRDYTLQELVTLAGLAVNVVSGRVHELKGLGHLEHAPKRACTVTGRTVQPVRLPPAPSQRSLFQ